MKKFCIVSNYQKDKDLTFAKWTADMIAKGGGTSEILQVGEVSNEFDDSFKKIGRIDPSTEAVIVLGGDGSMLSTVRELAILEIPAIGVNLGTVGVLTEIELTDIEKAIQSLLDDTCYIEDRVILKGTIIRKGEEYQCVHAVNDVIISRMGQTKILNLKVSVNGRELNRYGGDGVLVATPTGSTAYNLSAGGPILMTNIDGCVITPICAHAFGAYSFVTSAKDIITIEVLENKRGIEYPGMVSFDGKQDITLASGDLVKITKSSKSARFIRLNYVDYIESLKEKIYNS